MRPRLAWLCDALDDELDDLAGRHHQLEAVEDEEGNEGDDKLIDHSDGELFVDRSFGLVRLLDDHKVSMEVEAVDNKNRNDGDGEEETSECMIGRTIAAKEGTMEMDLFSGVNDCGGLNQKPNDSELELTLELDAESQKGVNMSVDVFINNNNIDDDDNETKKGVNLLEFQLSIDILYPILSFFIPSYYLLMYSVVSQHILLFFSHKFSCLLQLLSHLHHLIFQQVMGPQFH